MNTKLLLGDCLELMKSIDDLSIDCVIADPPYGNTRNRWDTVIDFKEIWKQLNRIVKPSGAIIIFGQEPFSSYLRLSNPKNYRYDWIWEKTLPVGFLNAKKMPLRAHEIISVFYKKLPTYNPQKTTGHPKKSATRKTTTSNYGKADKVTSYSSTERYPRTVLKFGTDKHKNPLHPTQKPLKLIEYLVKTYTNKGDTVLDFTMGSGTTGLACLNLERDFIGIEILEEYFNIAKNRIISDYKLREIP